MANSQMILNRIIGLSCKFKLCTGNLSKIYPVQSCWISGKQMRDPSYKRAKPWPYETKKYKFWHGYFDNTLDRFDENTKIIVVDGNIAAGKSTFAKSLANELDMKYFPEVTMDYVYINDYGFDLRQLDHKLPVSCRSCDIKKFYEDPHNINVAFFQKTMYDLRFEQYLDAMAHLLNTGQGVVIDRSIYSDFVFLEVMYKLGYISKTARSYYYEVKDNTIWELLRPHLIIYLDVPVPQVMERIKKRNIPFEVKSKVLTPEYLNALEYNYKQKFLKELSPHSELLIYDWSNYGDIEVVVEDIEGIDFDSLRDSDDKKFKDWKITDKWKWNNLRRRVTNEKAKLFNLLRVCRLDVPELIRSAEDNMVFEEVMSNAPGEKFQYGYNPEQGDKGIFFKSKIHYRDNQRPKIWY